MQRQRQHKHVAVHATRRKCQQAGECNRNHEQIYQHQIDWIQPDCALDFIFVVVFDNGHMELPRQHNKCHEGQQRHRHECVDARLPAEDGGGGWSLHCLVEQRHWAVEHPEGDENSDSEERHQFDDDSAATASIRPSWCSVASI